jgi:hypothetical protein
MKPRPLPTDRDTINLLCSIVNRYSQGGPYAMPDTLKYVMPGFLYECVQKAISSGALSDVGKKVAQDWANQKVED